MEIKIKDHTEDVGFICKTDPWEILGNYHGEPFREYRRKWKLASNFELEPDFPLQLDFELNDNCNLHCNMCILSAKKKAKAAYFPIDKFKDIVKNGVKKGLSALDLSFLNEPLIRVDLPELIKFSKEAGVLDIGFNTNSMLLDDDYSDALLKSGLTRIQFSVDAHSPEIYNKIRVGGNYNKVKNNILSFIHKKNRKRIKGLLTAVSFIRMSVNEHEKEDFTQFWKDKVDYIIFREYLNPSIGNSANFKDKKRLFAKQRHVAKKFRCNKPWQRLIVRTDGTVLPCCVSFSTHLPMGNIFRDKIYDIWNSNKMKELRKIHKDGDFFRNKVCLECAKSSTSDF